MGTKFFVHRGMTPLSQRRSKNCWRTHEQLICGNQSQLTWFMIPRRSTSWFHQRTPITSHDFSGWDSKILDSASSCDTMFLQVYWFKRQKVMNRLLEWIKFLLRLWLRMLVCWLASRLIGQCKALVPVSTLLPSIFLGQNWKHGSLS